jgi:Icc-related predicted phosphoesterase
MKIDCISDLHGEFPTLQGGDMLIVAGDLVGHSTREAYIYFDEWIGNQDYRFKVVIAGNHDTFIKGFEFKNCTYLEDSGCEFEGLKIWGSPWTAWFHGINPRCKAFTKHSDDSLAKKWAMIPKDTNILITHMPPKCMFDKISRAKEDEDPHVGSSSLRNVVSSTEYKNLKLCVWGHIHEEGGQAGGQIMDGYRRQFVNASILDGDYVKVNDGVRIEL